MTKRISIVAIALYQRFISPYKGFHCAHAHLHGGQTCSNAVKAIVHEHGLIHGMPHIKARFHACAAASVSLACIIHEDMEFSA